MEQSEKKHDKFRWIRTLTKKLLKKLEDPSPEYEDPDEILTVKEPFQGYFFPYSKHQPDRDKLTRHVQIDVNNGLRNLEKQAIGTLVCKDQECPMKDNRTIDEQVEAGKRSAKFIPDDPVVPAPHGCHYIDSPVVMAREPLSDEITYFVRIPNEFEKITKDNVEKAKAHITRNIRKVKRGRPWKDIPETDLEYGNYVFDSEWQSDNEEFLDEEVLNLEKMTPMENPIEVLEKTFEGLLIDEEKKELEKAKFIEKYLRNPEDMSAEDKRGIQEYLERQEVERKWGRSSLKQWDDQEERKWRESEEKRNNSEWRKNMKRKLKKKGHSSSSSSGSSDENQHYLKLKPEDKQGRSNNSTEQAIWMIPRETDVPVMKTFLTQLEKMLRLIGCQGAIDKATWDRIREEEMLGIMLFTDHRTMEMFKISKCNQIAFKINNNQLKKKASEMAITMRKSGNWIFARDSQENIKSVRPDLQITLFQRIDDLVWTYLMNKDGKTGIINEIPELIGQNPYSGREAFSRRSKENWGYKNKSKSHRYKNSRKMERSSDMTLSSSEDENQYGKRDQKEDSEMGAEIDKELGVGVGLIGTSKGIRKLSVGERGRQGVVSIRALGCKVAEDTLARVRYGIGILAIPVYQSEDVSELEQTVARPQLFRDVVRFWKDAFLIVLSRFKVEGRSYSELRPTFDNRRSTNQMRQVKTLIEAVPYYTLDMESSNRATFEQHLEFVIQYMIASGISHKLSDIVIEKSFSKRGELSKLVNASAREHGIHAETLRSLVSFWLSTLCNNVQNYNSIEEQESVAIKLCYNEFAKFAANKAINVAREHAMRLAPQNRSILRRIRENLDTKEAVELVKEDLLRKILLGGAEANNILVEAQRSYNSPSAYHVQSSAMGQLLDFSTQPIETMISALRLATRLQMDKFASTNIIPKIKTGAVSATSVPRSPSRSVRNRDSSQDRSRRTRSPDNSRRKQSPRERGSRPRSATGRSPQDVRRRNLSPATRSRSRDSNQSRRRTSPRRGVSPTTRTSVGAAKSEDKVISAKCPFCKKNDYDCIKNRNHCKNTQHYTLSQAENLKTALTREDCIACKEKSKDKINRARSPRGGEKNMSPRRYREDSLDAARTAQRVKDRIWDRTALYGPQ